MINQSPQHSPLSYKGCLPEAPAGATLHQWQMRSWWQIPQPPHSLLGITVAYAHTVSQSLQWNQLQLPTGVTSWLDNSPFVGCLLFPVSCPHHPPSASWVHVSSYLSLKSSSPLLLLGGPDLEWPISETIFSAKSLSPCLQQWTPNFLLVYFH